MNVEPVKEHLEQVAQGKLAGLASVVASQALVIEDLQHKTLALTRDLKAAQARIRELEQANESH